MKPTIAFVGVVLVGWLGFFLGGGVLGVLIFCYLLGVCFDEISYKLGKEPFALLF